MLSAAQLFLLHFLIFPLPPSSSKTLFPLPTIPGLRPKLLPPHCPFPSPTYSPPPLVRLPSSSTINSTSTLPSPLSKPLSPSPHLPAVAGRSAGNGASRGLKAIYRAGIEIGPRFRCHPHRCLGPLRMTLD